MASFVACSQAERLDAGAARRARADIPEEPQRTLDDGRFFRPSPRAEKSVVLNSTANARPLIRERSIRIETSTVGSRLEAWWDNGWERSSGRATRRWVVAVSLDGETVSRFWSALDGCRVGCAQDWAVRMSHGVTYDLVVRNYGSTQAHLAYDAFARTTKPGWFRGATCPAEEDYAKQALLWDCTLAVIEDLAFAFSPFVRPDSSAAGSKSAHEETRVAANERIAKLSAILEHTDAWEDILELGDFQEPAAVEFLIRLLDDKRSLVRGAACAALSRITGLEPSGDIRKWKEWWLTTSKGTK
jgi:hypothetical protein